MSIRPGLNLRPGASLNLKVTAEGSGYTVSVEVDFILRGRKIHRVLDTHRAESEEECWAQITELAQDRMADLGDRAECST